VLVLSGVFLCVNSANPGCLLLLLFCEPWVLYSANPVLCTCALIYYICLAVLVLSGILLFFFSANPVLRTLYYFYISANNGIVIL
jgi:hypothetical protein